jgi:hypothetical protein
MTALLSPSFWFNPAPALLMPFMQTGFIVLFTAMTVLGVVAYVVRFRLGLEKLTRRALERAGNCLMTCGLLGLALVGMTYERIPFLSMRILFVVVLATFGYWMYKIYQYVWVEIPKIKANRQQQDEYNKWLPKRKK